MFDPVEFGRDWAGMMMQSVRDIALTIDDVERRRARLDVVGAKVSKCMAAGHAAILADGGSSAEADEWAAAAQRSFDATVKEAREMLATPLANPEA